MSELERALREALDHERHRHITQTAWAVRIALGAAVALFLGWLILG